MDQESRLSRRARALVEHPVAGKLLAQGCTNAELAAAIGRTERAVRYTLADLESAGRVSRVRPNDPVTGASLPTVVTLCASAMVA